MATRLEVSKRKLTNMYGEYGPTVLIAKGFLKALPRKKREMQKYEALAKLPPPGKEYKILRDSHYSQTVGEAISNALSDLESLGEELRTWVENMESGGFSGTSKQDTLEETASALENVEAPEIPTALEGIPVVYLPRLEADSRSARCSEAVGLLRKVIEELEAVVEDNPDAASLASALEDICSELDGLEFPGMFG